MSWLSGWKYRKSITLSRASGAVTNYQMALYVGESAGARGENVDCGGLAQSDFDDLRFTAADGITLLDYWIEGVSGVTPNQLAKVWVEFNSIGTGDTTFYMYYGKPDAVAASNGANTFILFDDFERGADGDTVGGNWTESQAHVHISTDQKYTGTPGSTRSAKFVGAAAASQTMYQALTAETGTYEVRYRLYKETATPLFICALADASWQVDLRTNVNEQITAYPSATVLGTITPDAWQHIAINALDYTAHTYDVYLNSAKIGTAVAMENTAWSANKLLLSNNTSGSGNDAWVDNVFVRNWRATEPAWGAWGSVERNTTDFPASDSWYDDRWQYRKSITLSRASGAVTNYQMKLLVGESSGATGENVDCGQLCRTDLGDLRFTAADGITPLDYWVESLSGATPNQLATIWIEFNSIGTGATTFYMYYGNADAVSLTSGANTFIVFEDFEWGSDEDDIETSGGSVTWTKVQGTAKVDTARSYAGSKSGRFTGAATYPSYTFPCTASADIAFQFWFYKESAITNGPNVTQGNGTERWVLQCDGSQNILVYGEGNTDSGHDVTADAWQQLEIFNFNYVPEGSWSFAINGVQHDVSGMYDNASIANTIRMLVADTTADRDVWFDNIIVRNWRATPPEWGAWGDAESIVFIEDILAETVTFTDAVDAYLNQDTIADIITITDLMEGTGFVDGSSELATLTDTLGRLFEVEREQPGESAIFTDLMEGIHLVGVIDEIITFDDRFYGEPGNAIRRKHLLWDLQNGHIQIKFSHNQAGKCAQAEDCAIRSALIRRQDSTRLCHQGDHLALKFQHNETGKTALLEMLSLQVNRVSNLFTVKWEDTGLFCHQGNHLQIKIQHNVASAPILLETHNLRVNQIRNP